MREKTSGQPWAAGGLDLVFIELPKADPAAIAASGPLRDWLSFLKNAPQWHTIPRTVKNPAVREALLLARHDSLSPAETETMNKRQLYRIDQKNMRLHALEEGMETGLQKGLQKGLREGRKEAMLQVDRTLLRQGFAPELVATATEMSMARVRALSRAGRRRAGGSRSAK